MNTNIIRSWNGRTIRQREDGYMSLTDMAQAVGKRVNDWSRLESSRSYIATLSRSTQIPADQLVQTNESIGSNEQRGTWGYRKVAIRFAQWCSDDFAVQVDSWVEELLQNGQVSLLPKLQTQLDIILASTQQLALIAQQMVEQERRLAALEQVKEEVSDRLAAIEVEQDRYNTPCGHKYSILGYAKMQGIQISCTQAAGKGRKASALCRQRGIQVERIHDPRFGKVGLYPESVLVEVFA